MQRNVLSPLRLTMLWMLVLLTMIGSGCSFDDPVGCRADSECRGQRICVAGTCQEPNAGNATSNGVPNESNGTSGTSNNTSSTSNTSNSTSSTSNGTSSTSNNTSDPADAGGPDADEPDTDEPDTDEPDVDEPDTDEPDVDEPDVSDTDQPDTDEPDVVDEPDADEPDVVDEPDADTSEPDVPELGPVVTVEPESIDFGEVGLFVSALVELRISNTGDAELDIERVGLQSEPSQGFQVIAPQNASDVLAPGEERIYQVRFRPTALRNDDATNYGNAVVVLTNDPERPEVNIELSGVAIPDPEQCLTFEVNAIDFGFVETGNISAETVTLSNCGEADVDVTSLGVEGSSAFTISFGGQLPRTLEPNARLTVIVNYTPEGPEEVQSVVTADSDGGTATLVATGGTTCPSAIALAQAEGQQPSDERIEGLVDSEFVFNGFLSSDPAGSELEYTWVVNAPEGSDDLQIDPNLESERFTMRPDVPGTYTAELSVRSTISGLESCSVSTITAVAFEEQLPVASVTLTWDSQADLDLHIVRSDSEGNFSDWGSGQQFNPEDIYFANLSPDFGEEGVDFDNPRHLGDDTNGNGPETIEFPSLEANRNYRIGINYARNRLGSDATNAEVTITLGESEPVVLTAELEEEGVFWIPAVLNGNGTVTPINEFE